MKRTTLALAFGLSLISTPLLADGDGTNVPYGTVANGAAAGSSSQGIIIPLILLAIVAAAVAAD